jgi:hypothetical protein
MGSYQMCASTLTCTVNSCASLRKKPNTRIPERAALVTQKESLITQYPKRAAEKPYTERAITYALGTK